MCRERDVEGVIDRYGELGTRQTAAEYVFWGTLRLSLGPRPRPGGKTELVHLHYKNAKFHNVDFLILSTSKIDFAMQHV